MNPDLTLPWPEVPVVMIDTETTGTHDHDEVVEIAAVRFENGKPGRRFASLIDPGIPIPPEASKVHGITDEMVKGKPRLADVAGELFKVCDGAAPGAYNAPFDRRMLHTHISGNDCAAFDPSWTWIDVYVIVAAPSVDKYQKGPGRLKLGATCFRWQVAHQSAHRALGDALATGELLYTLFERKMVASCTLGRLLTHTNYMRQQHDKDHEKFRKRMDAKNAKEAARG